jgi:hypothetical protein
MEVKQYGSRRVPIFLVHRHYIVWMALKSSTKPFSMAALAYKLQELHPKEQAMTPNYVTGITGDLISRGLADRVSHGLVRPSMAEWPEDSTVAMPLEQVQNTERRTRRSKSAPIPARFGDNEVAVFDFLKSRGPVSKITMYRESRVSEQGVRNALLSLRQKGLIGSDPSTTGLWAILEGATISPYSPGKAHSAVTVSKNKEASDLRLALKAISSELDWAVQRQLSMQPPYMPKVQEWLDRSQNLLGKLSQ